MKDILKDIISKSFDNAISEDFKIESEKKNGKTHVYVEGKPLTVLIGLSALEKSILDEMNMNEDLFEIIKAITGYEKEER